jgi:hypothetical protein
MKQYIIIDQLITSQEEIAKLENEITAYANRGFIVHTCNNYRTSSNYGLTHTFVLMERDK